MEESARSEDARIDFVDLVCEERVLLAWEELSVASYVVVGEDGHGVGDEALKAEAHSASVFAVHGAESGRCQFFGVLI
jgi:hypothetical protein